MPIVFHSQTHFEQVNWIFSHDIWISRRQIQAWTVFDAKARWLPADGWRGRHTRRRGNVRWQRTWIADVFRRAWTTAVETYRQIHQSRVSMSLTALHNRSNGMLRVHNFIRYEMQYGNGEASARAQSESDLIIFNWAFPSLSTPKSDQNEIVFISIK